MCTISALEDQRLRHLLIRQIVPFLPRIVPDLQILDCKVLVHEIAGHDVVAEVDGAGVTKAKGPVVQGAAERLPDTR